VKAITLLTDFGLKDAYVGIMKGVILSINPEAAIVDMTHGIEAQDITEAAFVLAECFPWFAAGTIHVAVVDPTVGSARRAIIAVTNGHCFVGPDNGVLSLVLDGAKEVYTIENPDFMLHPVSATFHGRDVFSPAAAHLSKGVRPAAFGRRVDDPLVLPGLFPEKGGETLTGRIVRFDRFGNGITNITAEALEPFLKGPFTIETGDMVFHGLSQSYYEKDFTCLIGSSGYLEFGYFNGSFRERTGVSKGEEARVGRLQGI
jgi:S-adenosyl-L-methionine hydrolase (adenosine-forming)